MKQTLLLGIATVLLAAGMIWGSANWLQKKQPRQTPRQALQEAIVQVPEAIQHDTERASKEPKTFDEATQIFLLDGESVMELPLREYLQGVLLGEMPVTFELEALKSQAVAARTFVLKAGMTKKHENADVCSDSACCQSWRPITDAETEEQQKLALAVDQTQGQVLTYDNQLIDATYFSCSGGQTESAVAVWGNEVPYLQSVESPGEERASRFYGEVMVDLGVFAAAISSAEPAVSLSTDPEQWLGEISYTAGGGVDKLEIGGIPFRGTQIRSLFGLNSTVFEVDITQNGVIFRTKGFGHRVGLSQHGANVRASMGETYTHILSYFYQGTKIKTLSLS